MPMLLPVTPESAPYVALAVFCCMACGFFLFVLFHWTQDSSVSKKSRPTAQSSTAQTPVLASRQRQPLKAFPQTLVSGQQPRAGHAHVARPRVVSPLATHSRAVPFNVLPIDAHPNHASSDFLETERA